MENQVLVVNPKEFGIEKKQALDLTKGLNPILDEKEKLREQFQELITQEVTPENTKLFRELRLKIRDNRTKGTDVWHKAGKEFFLMGGKFYDAIKNKENQDNKAMESALEDKENHFIKIEAERITNLNNSRKELVAPYVESVENLFLADMEEDVWNAYLSTKKQKFEDLKAAEEKAEAERIAAEEAEAERIKAQEIENKRLKAEAEKREKEIEAERKIEAEKQAKKDAEAKKEREKIEAENKKKLDAERKERERIQKELQAKEDAEVQAKIEAEKLKQQKQKEAEKLAKAPIKKQLQKWISDCKIESAPVSNETTKEIEEKFKAFKQWALTQIEKI